MIYITARTAADPQAPPEENGRRVAAAVLEQKVSPEDLGIDVCGLPAVNLISSFVNAFLYTLQERGFDITQLSNMPWKTEYASEAERLQQCVEFFLESKISA